jgi:hypothetical protein
LLTRSRSLLHLNANSSDRRVKGLSRQLVFAILALLVLLVPSLAWAQQDAAVLIGAACGQDGTKFDVQRREVSQSSSKPQPSKAKIVVYADSLGSLSGCGQVRIGIDGQWVSAACLGTWIERDVDPGVHHLCADFHWKPAGRHVALERFTAEVGNTYYFRANVVDSFGLNTAIYLDPINEDEGSYLTATEKKSESTVK